MGIIYQQISLILLVYCGPNLLGMYNPLPLLTPGLLVTELAKGKRFFVRQFYPRGMDAALRASFLVRSYGEQEAALAGKHLEILIADPNRFLYDVQIPEHREKLQLAARQPPGYKIFYTGHKGVDWKPPTFYQQKMRRYVQSMHPDWRTQKGGPNIEIYLCEEYGQMYLELCFGDDRHTVTLEMIENF